MTMPLGSYCPKVVSYVKVKFDTTALVSSSSVVAGGLIDYSNWVVV